MAGGGAKGKRAEIRASSHIVMPGLVPGIHVFNASANQDVDGRDKPGHDPEPEPAPLDLLFAG
jgi:hypothetical protein